MEKYIPNVRMQWNYEVNQMAKISDVRKRSAQAAASRANDLGGMIQFLGKLFFWIITVASVITLWVIYDNFHYGTEYTDWGSIWPLWGGIIGAWLVYTMGLLMVMAFGAIAQMQSESLEIQILQAQE